MDLGGFTRLQKRQDLVLGIAFLLITVFSSVRILRSFSLSSGRKVITTFNLLIFAASALRAAWFLVPNDLLETSYTPEPQIAFVTPGWAGTLASELLMQLGSLSLYGIFILIACYWVNMLRKLNSNGVSAGLARFKSQRLGTIELFVGIMMVLCSCEAVNVGLFLVGHFNSEQMILYDSILLTVISVAAVAEISLLSHQIQAVLRNLEAINNRNSQPQIRRIFAIIIVANSFFVTRVVLECALAVYLSTLMRDKHSFSVLISDKWWTVYIGAKHACEVLVLTLELIISTAIKSYDTGRHPMRAPNARVGPARQRDLEQEVSAADAAGESTSLLPRS
ncbi:hypothetical protein B484DRAFT_396760 [Ochromonadaceae sp. CCMP2298]|nr:hypothetical protein B484DRAFT_396760 [Ochromonadaceae sp. CCMP2298]|mmetsp:Transcript_21253/g.47214  ORF Transcript_21253/g.47214 Transcript_21253/m.47214 type:complete len:336 (+) Transcript_21253:181-1188(+)